MFCPRCSQEQISEETKFCSRCGFLLTAVWNLILGNQLPNENSEMPDGGAISPGKKGLKRGGKLMMRA